MSLLALHDYLAADTISGQASSVYAANTDIWSSPGNVAGYAYQCLGALLIGGSPASSVLGVRIVYERGSAKEDGRGYIALLGTEIDSALSPSVGLYSNEIGAITLPLDIGVCFPEEIADFTNTTFTELRIRYLLDENWRKKRKQPAYIPTPADNTLSSLNMRCTWERQVGVPNAKEIWSHYTVCYTLAVPKGP